MPYFYITPSFSVHFNKMMCPGLFLMPVCRDYYINEQIQKIMMKYKDSLGQLRSCYKLKLKTDSDFNKSIVQNEDGFFLRLF
jgi:hypothetical protein